MENGEMQSDVVAEWGANAPFALMHQYVPELRRLAAIALDAGAQDQPIATNTQRFGEGLSEYDIDHTDLPKIQRKDPALRDADADPEVGDVVEIVRDSRTADEAVVYRLVVE